MRTINDNITIGTGSTEDFFNRVRKVMQNLDNNVPIQASHTITFENPRDLLHFLNESKLNLTKIC